MSSDPRPVLTADAVCAAVLDLLQPALRPEVTAAARRAVVVQAVGLLEAYEAAAAHDFPRAGLWLVWSHEHRGWWGPNHRGYVSTVAAAGRYTPQDAARIVAEAESGYEEAVHEDDAPTFKPFLRRPPC